MKINWEKQNFENVGRGDRTFTPQEIPPKISFSESKFVASVLYYNYFKLYNLFGFDASLVRAVINCLLGVASHVYLYLIQNK